MTERRYWTTNAAQDPMYCPFCGERLGIGREWPGNNPAQPAVPTVTPDEHDELHDHTTIR